MKTLAEIAYDVWWAKRDEGCSPRNAATRARWAFLNRRDSEAWEAVIEAVSEAIFERLGAMLDEDEAAAEETFEGPAHDVKDSDHQLSETEVMDEYRAGCK